MICGPCGNGDHDGCEDRRRSARLYRSCPCHHVVLPEPTVKAPTVTKLVGGVLGAEPAVEVTSTVF